MDSEKLLMREYMLVDWIISLQVPDTEICDKITISLKICVIACRHLWFCDELDYILQRKFNHTIGFTINGMQIVDAVAIIIHWQLAPPSDIDDYIYVYL